jgi:hypothetical protein
MAAAYSAAQSSGAASAPPPPAESPEAAAVRIAQGNAHKLVKLLDMPDVEFANLRPDSRLQKWWDVLGVSKPSDADENTAASVKTLRSIYRANIWLARDGIAWIKNLVAKARLTCSACIMSDSVLGCFHISANKAQRHAEVAKHQNNVADVKARAQSLLTEGPAAVSVGTGAAPTAGVQARMEEERTVKALVVGSLASGAGGGAPLTPHAIPRLLSKSMLELLKGMTGGMPSAPTIINTTVPDAINIIKGRIVSSFEGKKLTMYIDGGAAKNLAYGRKVIVICASAAMATPAVLDVIILECHETAAIQMEQIEKVRIEYKIEKKNVVYVCADNAATNKATVDLLNTMGYKIIYARCLPHTFNLLMKAFMDTFDKKWKMATHLKLLRSFLLAGGGSAKKLLALEYGLAVSNIDFADTRWVSQYKAILYYANKQSPRSLKLARERLQELSDAGDKTAKEALEEPDVPRSVYAIGFDIIEGIAEEDLKKMRSGSELDLSKTKKELLKYFAQSQTYLAFQLMDILFGGSDDSENIATIFKVAQGDPDFAAKLTSRSTGAIPDALSSAKALVVIFTNLDPAIPLDATTLEAELIAKNTASRYEAIHNELMRRWEVRLDELVADAKTINESVLDARKPFDQSEADDWKASEYGDVEENIVPLLLESVKKAAAAVTASEGLIKLRECIAGLNTANAFNMNNKPRYFTDDSKLLEYIGFTGTNYIYSKRESVLLGWRTICDEWEPPVETLSPADNYALWVSRAADPSLDDAMRDICAHAAQMCMRPISSCCCERVYSFLEKMDAADRSNMSKKTLAKLLFINGNSHIIEDIVKTASAVRISAPVKAWKELNRKRSAEALRASDAKKQGLFPLASGPSSKRTKRG